MIKMKYGYGKYGGVLHREVLYGRFPIVIMNNDGMFPCAYMDVSNAAVDVRMQELPVHGGVTYRSDRLPSQYNIPDTGKWVGWDYSHLYDWNDIVTRAAELMPELANKMPNGKKWTTEEIYEECRKLADYIIKMESEIAHDE